MGTASVGRSARIVVRQLPQRMTNMYVVRSVRGVPDNGEVLTGELVRPDNCLQIPIRPVEMVIKD